jgi:transglutaminase/protease-like cytokinesis protein 3
MKYKKSIIVICTLVFLNGNLLAQESSAQFKQVDEYVKSLGSLDTLNMGTISYIVTKKFPGAKDKARAIFDWIAYNIDFDCKAARSSGNEITGSENILKTRKAVASGYAALFQDMCSVVKIRCLTVDGYAKNKAEQINEKPDQFNHTWVVVQLGQSPESWYYVDPAWGSGFTDDKMVTYTRKFNDAFFFANKTIFNFQHFPDNQAWLLGPGTRSLKDFLATPLVKECAYEYNIGSFIPLNGAIKAKLNKPVQFAIKVNTNEKIEIVSLEIGAEKKRKLKTVDYTEAGGNISFSYKFSEEDTYPVHFLINNKVLLVYMVEVAE